jgi:hypothetical protein
MGVPLYKDHSQHVPVHAHMLHTLSRQVHHIGISMRCRFGANGNVTLRPHTSQHGPSRPRGASVAQPHPRAHHALAVRWCAPMPDSCTVERVRGSSDGLAQNAFYEKAFGSDGWPTHLCAAKLAPPDLAQLSA